MKIDTSLKHDGEDANRELDIVTLPMKIGTSLKLFELEDHLVVDVVTLPMRIGTSLKQQGVRYDGVRWGHFADEDRHLVEAR